MGYGVDFMMGSAKWHGIAPNDEQLKIALNQLKKQLEIIKMKKIELKDTDRDLVPDY